MGRYGTLHKMWTRTPYGPLKYFIALSGTPGCGSYDNTILQRHTFPKWTIYMILLFAYRTSFIWIQTTYLDWESANILLFKWLKEEDWAQIKWISLADDISIAILIEYHLRYPEHLQDALKDLTLGSKKLYSEHEMLNENHFGILLHYSIPKSSLKVCKLVSHCMPKRK